MIAQQNKQRKKILTDPLTAFARLRPDASEQQASALETIWNEYIECKRQHEIALLQRKKLSRQIGEAKKNGSPVDDLIDAMKGQSSNLDSSEKQLGVIADRILGFFEAEKDPSEATVIHTISSNRYKQTKADVTRIDVSTHKPDDDHAAWNNYVESHPASSIYHRAEWQTLIHRVFGHRGYYLYAMNNNQEIVGILPMIRLKSRLFGDFMVSMPYFNYGGSLADSPSIEYKLMHAANSLAENLGVSHIEYRDDISREGLPAKTEKVNMILALPESHEQLWNGFSSKLRSQIRRSQRENTDIKCAGEDCLNDFYTVFSRNMRDLGTPVYAKEFFRSILKCFNDNSRIIVVYLKNRPVSAAFLLGYKSTLEIPWASTIKGVNHLSLNMLLYWEVLKFAADNQYQYFDFGRSTRNSGTFRFKQQWGAEAKQLYWHYWLNNETEMPSLNPGNPKYSLLINTWKMLPISITRFIGPRIVKNLP